MFAIDLLVTQTIFPAVMSSYSLFTTSFAQEHKLFKDFSQIIESLSYLTKALAARIIIC